MADWLPGTREIIRDCKMLFISKLNMNIIHEAQYQINLRLDWQVGPPSLQYILQNSVQSADRLASGGQIIIIIVIIQCNSNYFICVILLNLVYSRTYWLLTPPLKIVIFNWTSVSAPKQFWSVEKTQQALDKSQEKQSSVDPSVKVLFCQKLLYSIQGKNCHYKLRDNLCKL